MSIIEFIQDRARYYKCPVCGRRLTNCEVRMLNHVEDRFTVQVTCGACHVTFIVILAIQGEGVEIPADAELEVEVEVEALEASIEETAGPIEVDELLDVHLLLRQFDGPLTDLINQPEPHRR
ncbi:MAG TPA: hypothetical protein VF134_06065 [Candidatus Dormibacteraeota bacterium]